MGFLQETFEYLETTLASRRKAMGAPVAKPVPPWILRQRMLKKAKYQRLNRPTSQATFNKRAKFAPDPNAPSDTLSAKNPALSAVAAVSEGGPRRTDSIAVVMAEARQQLQEAKKGWINKALHPSRRGLLHKELGVPEGEKIPMEKIQQRKAELHQASQERPLTDLEKSQEGRLSFAQRAKQRGGLSR